MFKKLATFLLTFATCYAITNEEEGRVAHGMGAKLGQFPWQAAVFLLDSSNRNNYHCLGVLLDENHVLTTVKCVTDKEITAGRVNVHLGVLVARNTTNSKLVLSSKRDTTANLAVLKIDTVQFSLDIRGIKLADEEIDGERLARVSGWGDSNAYIHEILQYDDELEISFDGTSITSTNNPRHACVWDQGTGLITIGGPGLVDTLSGIARTNKESCEADNPPSSKYISTFQHRDFINAALLP